MLVGCCRPHCCVFVLIITCDVRNTIGPAQSTGFVMQGERCCQNTGLKEGRRGREAGGGRQWEKGRQQAGKRVPQQDSCYWNMSPDVAVVLTQQEHAVRLMFAPSTRTRTLTKKYEKTSHCCTTLFGLNSSTLTKAQLMVWTQKFLTNSTHVFVYFSCSVSKVGFSSVLSEVKYNLLM